MNKFLNVPNTERNFKSVPEDAEGSFWSKGHAIKWWIAGEAGARCNSIQ
jgi:hypothetical protein